MKVKLIATALLLAMLLGALGCTAVVPPMQENGALNENENLISGEKPALLGADNTLPTDNLINLAQTDENEEAVFQIVYNINASLRVKEQCEALSANIYDATGVTVPVVHSSEKQKTYEITVGDIVRRETVDKIDDYREVLSDEDFAICVIDTRIVVYATTDTALVTGVIFFMESVVQKSMLQKLYAIEKGYEFTYHPIETPPVTIEKSDNDHYALFTLTTGTAMFTYVRLSYTGNSGWRIQTKFRETDQFRDDGAAQVLAYTMGEYKLGTKDDRFYTEAITTSLTGDVYTVAAPDGSRVEINVKSFRMDFYTPSGKPASSITNISQNAGGSGIVGELLSDEAIFGTGERFNGANQRGKKIEMFTKDIWSRHDACYMVIPLLASSRGSGFFINNYEHMVIDLDSTSPSNHSKAGVWKATVTGAPLDCYVYTTEQIGEVIHNYSRLSGYANLPEEWTYGMLVCAYSPDLSQKWTADITPSAEDGRGEGIYEMIANMEANDLPWTGVLAEAWGPYYAAKHADLKELCDYVHSLGKKFLVYMSVGYAGSRMSGFTSSYLLTQTRSDGTKDYNLPDTTADTNNPDVSSSKRTSVYLDITNPEACEWFFDDYWDYLSNEVGVDGCKIDFCELLPENYQLNYFDENVPTAGSHHWYPSAFCAMFYDMISSKPDGGMCYSRGGGIGAQRAPYMWAGDQARHWSGIQYQLSAVLSSGLSGVPYMSYDMSGYQYGGDVNNKKIENESKVFLRGTAYSAFTVCIQTHGKVKRAYQFAEYEENGEHPYAYVTDIYRAYTKLHEHLTPYITELCEEASTTGMPVMRHLVLGWQDDKNVYSISDQFMLGDAFLIAPILSDTETRSVYLPEGVWVDLNTGEEIVVGSEGKTLTVTANIAQLPGYFNVNTESETAKELVDGVMELLQYAGTFVPEAK